MANTPQSKESRFPAPAWRRKAAALNANVGRASGCANRPALKESRFPRQLLPALLYLLHGPGQPLDRFPISPSPCSRAPAFSGRRLHSTAVDGRPTSLVPLASLDLPNRGRRVACGSQAWYLIATGLFFLLALSACAAPSYYNQAISGHMRLMNQREDVQKILASGEADPELLRELELSINIRDFAAKQLGLPENKSYTQYVGTGQSAVTWNVVAVPEFSLIPRKWCFLASGCVPYRGYFKEAAARKFAASLDQKGFDTTISPAIAYSTLGWFDDPLLDTMFQYSDEQLAAFIFHELAHQQLYIKGDTAFNEAYASFVEEAGLSQWLESEGRTGYAATRKAAEKASLQLNALLQSTRKELAYLYAGEASEQEMRAEKSAIFDQLRKDYQELVDTQWGGKYYYISIASGDLNNASLTLINTYQGGACAFEKLFRKAGSDILKFHQEAANKARLGKEARGDWLNQPCEDIASNSDM